MSVDDSSDADLGERARASSGEVATAAGMAELAPIARRGAAAVIDWMLFLFLATMITVPFVTEGPDGELVPNRWAYLAWVIVVTAIETFGVAWRGQTPGKRIAAVKVIAVPEGGNPSILMSFLRVAPVITALIVVPFPFFLAVIASLDLTALASPERRSLLDRFAHTAVITSRR